MQKDEIIKFSKEEREELKGLIKEFFLKEKGEEIGDLAADTFLDFVIEKLSKKFYNKGIYDAYAYLNDRSSDILGLQKD